jgi:hypothetical protein
MSGSLLLGGCLDFSFPSSRKVCIRSFQRLIPLCSPDKAEQLAIESIAKKVGHSPCADC